MPDVYRGADAFNIDPAERDNDRPFLLGDIFHSNPVVVGQPVYYNPDPSYRDGFKTPAQIDQLLADARRANINALQQDRARLSERYGEKHPDYQKAITALANSRRVTSVKTLFGGRVRLVGGTPRRFEPASTQSDAMLGPCCPVASVTPR